MISAVRKTFLHWPSPSCGTLAAKNRTHFGRDTMKTLGCAALMAVCVASAASAQISNDVVKIGVLTDQNGVFSGLAGRGSVVAAQMAVEDAGGRVLGKKVELIDADHQNKADVGAQIARQWFDVEGVDMVIDMPNSSVVLAVQQLAREKNRVSIASAAGT